MITEDKIHYAKSSIRKWAGETPRLKINLDVVGATTNKIFKLQWKMTQELRELRNGLSADAHWSTYDAVEQLWKDIRKDHGQGVKLWVGKLHERRRFTPGKTQNNTRIEFAVSLLVLERNNGKLTQYIWWDDWQHEQLFHDIEGGDYNRVWDYRNPLSSKVSGTNSTRIDL